MNAGSIKKVNLQQIQRPKTLVVIHYKGKRVSIPFFESTDNITQYLWHQLHKFQTTILQKQQTNKNSHNSSSIDDVIGFTCIQKDKNKIDIKMNILLSMSRLKKDHGKSRTDLKWLDITNYYKYLQIQPYYGFYSKQLIPQYQLFSVLSTGPYFTVYLGRRISDGRFYSVKICRPDSKISQNQLQTMKILHTQQNQYEKKTELQLIPQIQQVRKADGLFIYIYQYCPGGNLRNSIRKKLSQIQCLHYMKQLVWGVHTLHSTFNLIHRAICFENLEVDFVGNLRLVNFAYCQPCYSSSYIVHSSVPQSYQEKYEIANVLIPPQVHRSSRYNNLVDYYGVGAVLSQMLGQSYSNQRVGKRQKQGIQVAIQNLMAQNIRDRQYFANQVIGQLHEDKMKNFSGNSSKRSSFEQYQRLTFNKIYIGESINIEQKSINGIRHQQAIKLMKPSHDDQIYYLHPVNKSRKKSKNKSKEKSNQKVKEKSKSKSKQKKSIPGKLFPSTSVASSQKTSNSKNKTKNGSQKSLNKSIDSRNNSVKSGKSNKSKDKAKQNFNKPAMTGNQFKYTNNYISGNTIKSPPKSPKNQFHHTQVIPPQYQPPLNPSKLITTKSKNKL